MNNNQIIKVQELLPGLVTKELVDTLLRRNFFDAPASVKHHGNETGGLFVHSVAVAEALIDLTKKNNLSWQREESPAIVGLFHDMCKTDDYMMVIEDEGVEMMGGAIVGRTFSWDYNPEPIMKGHGDKSVVILSTMLQLTEEEMFCIRYHMGAFTEKEEWRLYTRAVNKFPNVLWTHQADMIAAHILGV
jgi:hypothetical protein